MASDIKVMQRKVEALKEIVLGAEMPERGAQRDDPADDTQDDSAVRLTPNSHVIRFQNDVIIILQAKVALDLPYTPLALTGLEGFEITLGVLPYSGFGIGSAGSLERLARLAIAFQLKQR